MRYRKSKLRKPEPVDLGKQYAGSKVSREALEEDSDDDPFKARSSDEDDEEEDDDASMPLDTASDLEPMRRACVAVEQEGGKLYRFESPSRS